MIQKLRFALAWVESILLVPIMVLHEASHMAACLVFRADLYELFLLLHDGNEGIRCWGVWHEDLEGPAEVAISLAPLVWLPIGWLAMDLSVWLGLYLFLTGFSGLGDVLHVLHYTGIATIPLPGFVDFDELEELHDDRITIVEFSGRST